MTELQARIAAQEIVRTLRTNGRSRRVYIIGNGNVRHVPADGAHARNESYHVNNLVGIYDTQATVQMVLDDLLEAG